jgi:hypothetical protein
MASRPAMLVFECLQFAMPADSLPLISTLENTVCNSRCSL